LNLSIRQNPSCKLGKLRHLGWEDATASELTTSTDVNSILWRNFTAEQQADEIRAIWPGADYSPYRES